MRFEPTPLAGAWIVAPERREDERGFFARTWCRREFDAHGLMASFVQANVARTRRKGTIRGLHYQVAPFQEAKLVRCLRGAIWDVIVDMRPASATYLQWFGTKLTADDGRQIYVPEDFAHGYQTLADDSEVTYQVSAFHEAGAERGVRWNDPRLGIAWPVPGEARVSPKDRAWPDVAPAGPPAAMPEERPDWRDGR